MKKYIAPEMKVVTVVMTAICETSNLRVAGPQSNVTAEGRRRGSAMDDDEDLW